MSTYSDLQLDALRRAGQHRLRHRRHGAVVDARPAGRLSASRTRAPSPLADAVDAAGPAEEPVTAVAMPVIGDLEGIVLMLFSVETTPRACARCSASRPTPRWACRPASAAGTPPARRVADAVDDPHQAAAGVPPETCAASDWNLRPEHPHWPLRVADARAARLVRWRRRSPPAGPAADRRRCGRAAALAVGGAGRRHVPPRAAGGWPGRRCATCARSWLSREVALLSMYTALAGAGGRRARPGRPARRVAGVAGVYASARLYVVPGRPAWDTPADDRPLLRHRGRPRAGARRAVPASPPPGSPWRSCATAANWWRLSRRPDRPWRGRVRLELRPLPPWRRLAAWRSPRPASVPPLAGAPAGGPLGLVVASELVGRWLFYVTVVPLNMPGAFWRGTAGGHR